MVTIQLADVQIDAFRKNGTKPSDYQVLVPGKCQCFSFAQMPDIEPLYMSDKSSNGRSNDDEIRQTGLHKMPHIVCCNSR